MDDEVSKAKAQKKTNALFVLACTRGYLADVQALLEQGADPQAADKRRVSALHYACGQGRLEVVKFLWSRGAELDAEDPDGNLPLHFAVRAGRTAVVRFLLQKGCWVEGSDARDDTPLHIAARKGQDEAVRLLLEGGAKATLRDVNKRGLTALGEALLGGHTEAAQALVEAGADWRARPRGWALLQLAAARGQAVAVRALLGWGAKPDDAASKGDLTPLHCAALGGSLPAARALLEAGADAAAADAADRQPRDLAPADAAELRRALHTHSAPRRAAPAAAAAAGAGNAPAAPLSDADEFRALGDAERLARVDRWAAQLEAPNPNPKLERTLAEFPLELRAQLRELQRLRQVAAIQQEVVQLLADGDFQALAAAPGAAAAVERVHSDREAFQRYAEDRDTMELLRHLQRFQAVVRANGGHRVPFQALLRGCEPGYQEKSGMRLKGMQLMLGARRRAAVAAALSETEAEAKERAARELDPKQQQPQQQQGSSRKLAGGGAEAEIQPARAPESDAPGREGLPVFTWQRLGQEMLRSLIRSAGIVAVVLLLTYLMSGRMPWQLPGEGSQPAPGAGDAGAEL